MAGGAAVPQIQVMINLFPDEPPAELRAKAQRVRTVARAVSCDETGRKLFDLADEYEARAAEIDARLVA